MASLAQSTNVSPIGISLGTAAAPMSLWYGECPGPIMAYTKARRASPPCLTPSPFLNLFSAIWGTQQNPTCPRRPRLQLLSHLRELMHKASAYPWEGVRNYHGIWLGMMEQNELTWADRPLIQELRLQYARQSSPAHTATRAQAQNARHSPCSAYQSRTCSHNGDHGSDHGSQVSHICAWCFRVRHKACQHPESGCITKQMRELTNDAADLPK